MGGVGKTTLVQHVFNDPRIDEAKFDVRAWVCVSEEFDVFKVSRAILEHVTTTTDDSRDTEMVHRRLKEKLTGEKFLIVLDDVWNENQSKWGEVQKALVFGAQGSRILVTTRNKEVASIMRSEEHSLEQLQEDHSWKLFAKHAFRDDDTQANPECMEIGTRIVKRCKGLPLALKTMGSLLYNKSSVPEWKTVLQSEIWEFSKERCDIIPALALSYIHLPSHLKVCFAYFALFPKDYEFRKEHLIHLWMTEKFLYCPQHSKIPEDICQQYFNDLLSRSFFQQSGEKKEVFGETEEVFVMHDLLHDLAKYVGGGIYFRCEVDQQEKIQKVTRHFSVELGLKYFDDFGTLCNTQRLRTFIPTIIPTRSIRIKMSIHELLSKFKFLHILSLAKCSYLQELPDSVANLVHLRSLDLSSTGIRKLSEKICSLSLLQILKLNKCMDLMELPSNLYLLTNLCRLEFQYTRVRKVPPHLGKLKNLKVAMTSFIVGHGRELGIQELGELNLDKSLSIGELQNIENPLDASKADLKNKTLLVDLTLRWGRNGNFIDSKKEEDVFENLQPSKNLKELSIFNYGGNQFPNWFLENSLLNMVSLWLEKCESCQRLPPLGVLPFLKVLRIIKLDGIVSIDADFHGNNSCSFNSLETLSFSNMRQWEKWDCQAVPGAFPRLIQLFIIDCPKLKGQLPQQVVPLERLQIVDCEQLEDSAPRALNLELRYCGKLQLDWAAMKELTMKASLVEIVGSDTLEHLDISEDCVSLRTFSLDFFPTLKTLILRSCPELESFSGNMHMLLPSLRSLWIEDCPRLESFPDGGLPSNLNDMALKNCSRLVGSLKGALGDNLSLKSLRIEEVDTESFPEEGLLPLSLTSLTISHSPNLQKLDHKALYQLSSLQTLVLLDCPNVQRLPEEGLPKSILHFGMINCPLLYQRCQKEGGEDWEKIAHIQTLQIWY